MSENGKEGGAGLWRYLGPVAVTLVLTMSGTYFLFLQHMVTESELDKVLTSVMQNISALQQDIRRIEAIQNQRGGAITEIPTMRQELNKVIMEAKVLQTQLDGLRRNVVDLRYGLQKGPGEKPSTFYQELP